MTTTAAAHAFILHSQECKDSGVDLRDCPYSLALDRGILMAQWSAHQDAPVKLWVDGGSGRLVPLDTLTPRNIGRR